MENKKIYLTTLHDFIQIQKTSFCWFISKGLSSEFEKFSSILDFTGSIEVSIFGHEYQLKKPKYSEISSKDHDSTYSTRVYLPIEIRDKELNLVTKRKKVFIGTLPLMTNNATFIINGCERIIISQIIRSPGIYYIKKNNLSKRKQYKRYSATIICESGPWLVFEFEPLEVKFSQQEPSSVEMICVYLNKTEFISVPTLLQKIGLTKQEILRSVRYPDKANFSFLSDSNYLKCSDESINFNISKIFDNQYYNLGKAGRQNLNRRLKLKIAETSHTLTYDDIIKISDNLIAFREFNIPNDDIDHLKNKKVRSVGQLLQNQFQIGLKRLERTVSERMTICDPVFLKLSNIINPNPLLATMKEFLGSSQLSQYMDQTNPLSALTHKRRISGLGPGGLNRDKISFAVRDIHPSHYGRICPIETPEGQNAGLLASLTTCARVNNDGFIETPFWRVINGKVIKSDDPIYLTADLEDEYKIAPGDISVNNNDYITRKFIPVRYKQDFITVGAAEVDFLAVSSVQIVSPAAALIPFFEHDDANRALMGSNMQRQSVPLLLPQKPIVGTGFENQITVDSGMAVIAFNPGVVIFVSARKVVIKENSGNKTIYYLQKYCRSNQNTCINQRPIVWVGEKVASGQVLADGPSSQSGELALGQNLIVAYMPWHGYNFEDAILINERLVFDDVFTSIHIQKYDVETTETKAGSEKFTKDIPHISPSALQNLDENGIIYQGTFVKPGDILVGKITPKGESDQLPEAKLLRAIFGEKATNVRDTSLRVPNGGNRRVLDIKIFNRKYGDELPVDATALIRVFLAQIRKIQVGDKIAGRHGNKGIISRILPRQDMPYLPDGTPVDVILNPLGVPSRMNVGQLYECLLGLAGDKLNRRFKILPFDEMYGSNISRILINKKLRQASKEANTAWLFNPYCPGKMVLIDGRNGNTFENPITVGKAYMLKLIHLVDDKIHARSTGPYSLITQQPLGGKSRHGGQRFGEMEVWALEAFGAAYMLQELLTIKSDDIQGRNDTLNAIVKGRPIPKSGIPESFKVLMRELQAIGLDITTYRIDKYNPIQNYTTEVNLMETYEALSKQFLPTSILINPLF